MKAPAPIRLIDGSACHGFADGQPAYAPRYAAVSAFSEARAVAYGWDGSALLIDTSGMPVHGKHTQFRWILAMHQGLAACCTVQGEHGDLDLQGNFHPRQVPREIQQRTELTRIAHLLYQRGYNVSIDGNLSMRLSDGEILISPTGSHLGFVRPEDFVVVDPAGRLLRGTAQPTSEYRLHVALYQQRPDIQSVVHAHSPYAVAASLAGVDLHKTYITAAPIPTTEYARISSAQSAAAVAPHADLYNWAILPRHGTVAWAATPWEAFLRIEGLEHCAKVVMTAGAVGVIEPLPNDKCLELLTFWGLQHLDQGEPDERTAA